MRALNVWGTCALLILCAIGCTKNASTPHVTLRFEPPTDVAYWITPCNWDIYHEECVIKDNLIRFDLGTTDAHLQSGDVSPFTDIDLGELLPGTYLLFAGYVSIDSVIGTTEVANKVYRHESSFQVLEGKGKQVVATTWN